MHEDDETETNTRGLDPGVDDADDSDLADDDEPPSGSGLIGGGLTPPLGVGGAGLTPPPHSGGLAPPRHKSGSGPPPSASVGSTSGEQLVLASTGGARSRKPAATHCAKRTC